MALSPDDIARLRGLVADNTFTKRFDLEREIGAGGMGRVFVASEKDTNRKIAIKLIEASMHGDAERFQKEADLLEQLEHPAIVSYIAHGVTSDGRAYLAMTWLEGESLAERLKRAPVALAEVVTIGERVAGALAYLHERGIVHRDIKPSNVFLVGKSAAGATVIDLGIAKKLDATQKLTRTGQLIGTPGYMAPEQVMGESTIDGRVDMFALGCLLYESLSGKLPFPGDAVMEVLAHLLLHDPKPLDEVSPGVPARLATLVALLLAKEASERTIDAKATAAELAEIGDALAKSDAARLATSPFKRPVLGSATTLPDGQAATVRDKLTPPPARSRTPMLVLGGAVIAAIAIVIALVVVARRSDPPPGSGSSAVPRNTRVTLPAGDDVPQRKPANTSLTGTVIDVAHGDQLGSNIVGGAWCRKLDRTIVVTEHHEVWSIPPNPTEGIDHVARLDPGDVGTNPDRSVVCLDGKILVAIGDRGFAIAGSAITETRLPAGIVEGVALADNTARWLAPDKLVAWSGDAVTEVAGPTCKKPRRLSPRGDHILCADDTGNPTLDGGRTPIPEGEDASWSADGAWVYFARSQSSHRWKLGTPITRVERVAAGRTPLELGKFTLTYHHHHYWLTTIADGKTVQLAADRERPPIALIPERGELVVELGAGQGVRVLSAAQPELALSPTRHHREVRAIAFSQDGARLATIDRDSNVIMRQHQANGGARTAFKLVQPTEGLFILNGNGPLLWRADGNFTWLARGTMRFWKPDGIVSVVSFPGEKDSCVQGGCRAGSSTVVPGSDEILRANLEGIAAIEPDGKVKSWLLKRELARVIDRFRVDHEKRFALIDHGARSVILSQVYDLATGEVVLELANPGDRQIQHQVLAGRDRPIVVLRDRQGHVFIVDAERSTPLWVAAGGRSSDMITSPRGRLVAIVTGADVSIVDVEQRREVAQARFDNEVSAIAWDRTGKLLAVAAADTELRVFEIPDE